MAGIYIHIPFCKKLCYYCDFHFSVSLKQKDRLIKAIHTELLLRRDEFEGFEVGTIYFGGGTPSILSAFELAELLETIARHYKLLPEAEITIEANPDDLNKDYLESLKSETGINRFSIGTQSFDDKDLKLMNRKHSAREAYESIVLAKESGYNNLNIDLIYGVPGMSMEVWQRNLETFASLEIPHLSAYHLTFEPKTVFSHYRKKGKLKPVDEELSLEQFELLRNFALENKYEHYEISNFATRGAYSKHNMAYWTGKPYLGIGPSAHSFKDSRRRWNVANNTKYCEELEAETSNYFEFEIIDNTTAYHDYILTALRTKWGINIKKLSSDFSEDVYQLFTQQIGPFIENGMIEKKKGSYVVSEESKFLTDHIISELMIV